MVKVVVGKPIVVVVQIHVPDDAQLPEVVLTHYGPAPTCPGAAAVPVISCFALAASYDARASHSTGLDHS